MKVSARKKTSNKKVIAKKPLTNLYERNSNFLNNKWTSKSLSVWTQIRRRVTVIWSWAVSTRLSIFNFNLRTLTLIRNSCYASSMYQFWTAFFLKLLLKCCDFKHYIIGLLGEGKMRLYILFLWLSIGLCI